MGNAWRKSGLKREDLFLVTKVWISNAGKEKAQIATMNQYDTGNINFSDPQFVKYLIKNYG